MGDLFAHRPERSAEELTHEGPRERLVDFLLARLTEDLSEVWARGQAGDPDTRPGIAVQAGVVDDLLTMLRSGRLPDWRELRFLLYGYGGHPDYEPAWVELLVDAQR